MRFETCLLKIKAAAKQAEIVLTEEDLNDLARMQQEAFGGVISKQEFKDALTKKFIEQNTEAATQAKNRKLMALKKLTESSRSILARDEKRTLLDNVKDFILGGGLEAGEGMNRDILDIASDFEGRFQKSWMLVIKEEDLKAASLGNAQLEREVFLATHLKGKGTALDADTRAKYNISDTAARIAEAAHATINKMLEIKQAYDPYIEKSFEYIIRRFHDADRIRAVSKETWVADAMNAYGEKTFGDVPIEKKIKLFQDMYDEITGGRFYDSTSKGDVAGRMKKRRQLVANSPEAAADYNTKYGYGNFLETMDRVIQQTSRDVALLEKFGDPDMFRELLNDLIKRNASSEELQLLNSQGKRKDVSDAWYTATHMGGDIAVTGLGRFVDRFKALKWLSAGGNAGLRSLNDMGTSIGIISSMNVASSKGFAAILQNSHDILGNFIGFMSDRKQINEFLENVNLFSHAARTEMMLSMGHNPYKAATGIGGLYDRATYKASIAMGKYSVLRRINDSMKSAVTFVFSRNFATAIENGVDKAALKELSRYGVGEAEIALYKKAISTAKGEFGEIRMVTCAGVDTLSDSDIVEYGLKSGAFAPGVAPSKAEIARVRISASNRLGAMYGQLARISTSTPGSRQMHFMYGSSGKDNVAGAIKQLFWQFRGSATSTMDAYRRVWASGEGLSGKMSGVASVAVMNASLYAVGELAIQSMNGKTPESPTNPKFIMKALAGSGFGGIAADAIISSAAESGTMSGQLLKGLAGSTLGSLEAPALAGIRAAKGLATGQDMGPSADALTKSLVLDNMPFVRNFPIVSGVWNFYVANEIRDFMNSGYIMKQKSRMMDTPALGGGHQEYWLPK